MASSPETSPRAPANAAANGASVDERPSLDDGPAPGGGHPAGEDHRDPFDVPGSPSPPPSESPSTSSSISPHYDPRRDIILQMEFMPDRRLKHLIFIVWCAIFTGVAFLIAGLVMKLTRSDSFVFENNSIYVVNTVVATLEITLLLSFIAYYVRRLLRSNASHKRWSPRRKKAVTISSVELGLQLINAICFLWPNAHVLAEDCEWFSTVTIWTGFASWTCWNSLFLLFIVQAGNGMPVCGHTRKKYSFRPDIIMMDVPWWLHWPKLLMWAGFESVLLAITIVLVRYPNAQPVAAPGQSCAELAYDCSFSTAALVLLAFISAFAIGYLLLYMYYIISVFRQLRDRPYNSYRMGNMIVRVQIRLRGTAFAFFVICIVTYTYVGFNSCTSFVVSWFGYTPMQFVATAVAIGQAFMTVPGRPEETSVLQVWLQEFAWTERDIPRKRAERMSSLPDDSFEGFCMDCEPLFCFETAIKMMYWSYLVYEAEEQSGSPFTAPAAQALYKLDHFELVWDQAVDTKAILGWNDNTVVVAFRGTASMANVLADLQVWRAQFPRGEGSMLLGTAPMVHQGFLRAYTRGGFNDKLLGRVQHILNRCQETQRTATGAANVQVYVTGHSLGGALAVLCAYDIATRCPCAGGLTNIKCYTFGAPRVGNHAFARMYDERVPDTWQVINADDAVTRAGKFFVLYKHVGKRVLINRRGDLLVRPSYVEYALRRVPGGSVREHYLTQYQQAMVAVVAAQFGSKSLGGSGGVLSLAEDEAARTALSGAGLSAEQLKQLEHMGSGGVAAALEERAKSSDTASVSGDEGGDAADADNPSGLREPNRRRAARLLSWARRHGRRAAEPMMLTSVMVAEEDRAAHKAEEGGSCPYRRRAANNLLQCQAVCQAMRAKRDAAAAAGAAAPMGDVPAPLVEDTALEQQQQQQQQQQQPSGDAAGEGEGGRSAPGDADAAALV